MHPKSHKELVGFRNILYRVTSSLWPFTFIIVQFCLTKPPLLSPFLAWGCTTAFVFLFHSAFSFNHFQILSLPPSHSPFSHRFLSRSCLFLSPPPPPSPLPLSLSVSFLSTGLMFSSRQCVPHHSLCFLLSTVLLSVAATHAREKGWGGGVGGGS